MKYLARIIAGKGRGAKLGVPTLNFEIPKNFLYAPGIYAGIIYIENMPHIAAIHFGPIPTFNEAEPVLEAALAKGLLKKRPVTAEIELLHYIREIQNFTNSEELVKTIASDLAIAQGLLA